MTEYTVMMKVRGKWYFAHSPNNCIKRTTLSKDKITEQLEAYATRWDEKKEQDKKLNPNNFDEDYYPTDFKIMSREITEWTEVIK